MPVVCGKKEEKWRGIIENQEDAGQGAGGRELTRVNIVQKTPAVSVASGSPDLSRTLYPNESNIGLGRILLLCLINELYSRILI